MDRLTWVAHMADAKRFLSEWPQSDDWLMGYRWKHPDGLDYTIDFNGMYTNNQPWVVYTQGGWVGKTFDALPDLINYINTLETNTMTEQKTLGQLVEQLAEKKAEYNTAAAHTKQLKSDMTALEHEVMRAMRDTHLDHCRGAGLAITKTVEQFPQANEWPEVYEYIEQSHNHQILQRRLSTRAVLELIENGEQIPGISIAEVEKLSIRSM